MIANLCIYKDRVVAIIGEELQSKEVIIHEKKWMQLLEKGDDFSQNFKKLLTYENL